MTDAEAFETFPSRIVAQDMLPVGIYVSTVLLHGHLPGQPASFETMVCDALTERYLHYATRSAAERGHRRVVKLLIENNPK